MKPVPMLRTTLAWVLILAGTAGCGDKSKSAAVGKDKPAAAPAAEKTGSGNPITAPVDYLGAVGAAQKQAERVADITPVMQAIRAFQAGEDRMPKNLQELVTEGYLPKLPTPPRGAQLAYNPATGQVKFVPMAPPPAAPPAPAGGR